MQRTGRKTLTDLGRPDYSFYLFRRNPFRIVPVATQEPSFLTDRDDVFFELRRAIEISLTGERFEGRMLSADFGMGKSHILKFLRHRINVDLRTRSDGRAIAAYATPGKNMLDLYTSVLDDLGDEFLLEVSSSISGKYPDVRIETKDGQQYALWSDIGRQAYFVPKYVSDLWQMLPSETRRRMNKDYFAALTFLQDARYRADALYWLQGGRPGRSEIGAMGISSWITRDTAQDAFVTLVTALQEAGYDHVYLCLDEMEKLTYLSARMQSEFFEQLRYVIDQLTMGFSIFGSVTPEAWQILEDAQHAFQSRLRQFRTLRLPPMNSSEVLELVRDYMFEERLAFGEGKYPKDEIRRVVEDLGIPVDLEDDFVLETFPFSQDVIVTIGKQIRGNPRGIIRACAWLIDLGYDQKRVFYNVDETLELLGLQRQQEEAENRG